MLEWLGLDRLDALLDTVAVARREEGFWMATCAELADHVRANPEDFRGKTVLDSTSWATA